MGTVADKLNKLVSTKADIRETITAMGQTVEETTPFSGYAAKIRAISSDATAAAADILSGKTAYSGGKKITGTIASKGAADLTASGATVSVPAGYYPSAVSKSVATVAIAAPDISVASNGEITATVDQEAGYVARGVMAATKQLSTQAAATITPGTSAKTAVAAGRYTTGAVTVAGDTNLLPANIKKGISLFGVEGTLEGGGNFFVKQTSYLQDETFNCGFVPKRGILLCDWKQDDVVPMEGNVLIGIIINFDLRVTRQWAYSDTTDKIITYSNGVRNMIDYPIKMPSPIEVFYDAGATSFKVMVLDSNDYWFSNNIFCVVW